MDLTEEIVVVAGRDLALRRPRDPEGLLDEEAFDRDEFLPYWAELWPSGVALAQAVGTRALRGARVLELGCGLGVPSIAAALAGGRVLATDWADDALALVRDNADANGARLDTLRVDWRAPGDLLALAPFDLVLAADVLYERPNADLLAELLPQLGGEVLLADPGRATLDAFLERVGTVWRRPPVYRLR